MISQDEQSHWIAEIPSRVFDTMTPGVFSHWYFQTALPLWARYGVDTVQGGVHERLEHDLTPVSLPRRARLVARQIYCFSMGARLGENERYRDLSFHCVDFLARHLLSPSGAVRSSINMDDPDDGCSVARLYDDAFVLFALASHASLEKAAASETEALALRILSASAARCRRADGSWAEPGGPILTNPIMHLAEAALSWIEIEGHGRDTWMRLSKEIFGCLYGQMMQPLGCAVPEVFDEAWVPREHESGHWIEPGHQFEWAWLLLRWGGLGGCKEAFERACVLAETAETRGVDPTHRHVIAGLNREFEPVRSHAPLWAQTERVRLWHTMAAQEAASSCLAARAMRHRDEGLAVLERYISGVHPGLWHEVADESGCFERGPVKASSLYHLAGAAFALSDHRLIVE